MGIVRKPAIYSSSDPGRADAGPLRRTRASVPGDEGPAPKLFRHDESHPPSPQTGQPETPVQSLTVLALQSAEILPGRPVGNPLERYRLKSPASLPQADARGLRVFKGRQYVDIASGEIVQVRQTATTGEYRATLVSEREASGPPLYFDPQGGIWKLQPARSSTDESHVVDIDIDQLIREVRNDALDTERVHVGSDDPFERSTALDTTLFARGLKQFTPEQAAVIRSELRVVEGIFHDASRAIALNLSRAEAIYASFFGSNHRDVAQPFADAVARGLALSREYQGVWGEAKIVGVDSSDSVAAWMYKRDFHGRLFINRKFMQPGFLCLSLGHEMLHTNRVDRFRAIGPNAADFFYLKGHLSGLLGSASHAVQGGPERAVSDIIMRGGLTVAYLKAFGDDHDSFLFRISDYLGLGDDLDLRAAVELFNANSPMRAQMAVSNADSLIYAAKNMQLLYRSAVEHAPLDRSGTD